jgi:hypothetical protein
MDGGWVHRFERPWEFKKGDRNTEKYGKVTLVLVKVDLTGFGLGFGFMVDVTLR